MITLDFTARRVLVTGAARGIGAGIVQAFVEAGAAVTAVDLHEPGLAELQAWAGRAGGVSGSPASSRGDGPGTPQVLGTLSTQVLDLTDAAATTAALAGLAPDVLVHVAGGVRGQAPQPLEDVDDQAWMDIYQANVMTALHALRPVIPAMKARGSGRIVTITSSAGLKPSRTGIQSYCSAKHGLVGLTRQLALELGPHGITVNSVAPGFLRTSPDYERQWQSYGPQGQAQLVQGLAMRRLGEPQDIAAAVLFLASDHASWITGQVLPVSGHPFP